VVLDFEALARAKSRTGVTPGVLVLGRGFLPDLDAIPQ
jgi:hypothetical protein